MKRFETKKILQFDAFLLQVYWLGGYAVVFNVVILQ